MPAVDETFRAILIAEPGEAVRQVDVASSADILVRSETITLTRLTDSIDLILMPDH
jgi:hypothetical protein